MFSRISWHSLFQAEPVVSLCRVAFLDIETDNGDKQLLEVTKQQVLNTWNCQNWFSTWLSKCILFFFYLTWIISHFDKRNCTFSFCSLLAGIWTMCRNNNTGGDVSASTVRSIIFSPSWAAPQRSCLLFWDFSPFLTRWKKKDGKETNGSERGNNHHSTKRWKPQDGSASPPLQEQGQTCDTGMLVNPLPSFLGFMWKA